MQCNHNPDIFATAPLPRIYHGKVIITCKDSEFISNPLFYKSPATERATSFRLRPCENCNHSLTRKQNENNTAFQ